MMHTTQRPFVRDRAYGNTHCWDCDGLLYEVAPARWPYWPVDTCRDAVTQCQHGHVQVVFRSYLPPARQLTANVA